MTLTIPDKKLRIKAARASKKSLMRRVYILNSYFIMRKFEIAYSKHWRESVVRDDGRITIRNCKSGVQYFHQN